MTAQEFTRELDKADGYITLGLLDEASRTLDEIPTHLKLTKEVLSLKLVILVERKSWAQAAKLAEALCVFAPARAEHLIRVAFYLDLAGDHIRALQWLWNIEYRACGHPGFYYVKAQAHAGLGELQQAREALRTACSREKQLREAAQCCAALLEAVQRPDRK